MLGGSLFFFNAREEISSHHIGCQISFQKTASTERLQTYRPYPFKQWNFEESRTNIKFNVVLRIELIKIMIKKTNELFLILDFKYFKLFCSFSLQKNCSQFGILLMHVFYFFYLLSKILTFLDSHLSIYQKFQVFYSQRGSLTVFYCFILSAAGRF